MGKSGGVMGARIVQVFGGITALVRTGVVMRARVFERAACRTSGPCALAWLPVG